MRLHVCAVGRMRAGPEKLLFDAYCERAGAVGRQLHLGPVALHEVEDKRGGGPASEAALLARTLPKDAQIVALDERGRCLASPEFAKRLSVFRDAGARDTAFLVGGADGLADELRRRAHLVMSFGPMVWPHMLARVMLAEQLYRAVSILAGAPYHRA